MRDHGGPSGLVVMGAVDAHGLDAETRQVRDKLRSLGRAGGKRDHQAHRAFGSAGAEDRIGAGGNPRLSGEEIAGSVRQGRRFAGAGQRENATNGGHRGHHAAFRPAQRRQAGGHQALLQVAQVAVTQGQVVRQVARAVGKVRPLQPGLPGRGDRRRVFGNRLGKRIQFTGQGGQVFGQHGTLLSDSPLTAVRRWCEGRLHEPCLRELASAGLRRSVANPT